MYQYWYILYIGKIYIWCCINSIYLSISSPIWLDYIKRRLYIVVANTVYQFASK
ncbi:hypothetical protein HMPREF9998_01047 [Peptostreptococcus anaerobius VPI 4330 = DSM 2949]|nr:hypothetical protein HMPREF9998_01047 [Peptostreptococcus anaerobius VPI 4330 = DSM 2949]